jgi:hypothetical protein
MFSMGEAVREARRAKLGLETQLTEIQQAQGGGEASRRKEVFLREPVIALCDALETLEREQVPASAAY